MDSNNVYIVDAIKSKYNTKKMFNPKKTYNEIDFDITFKNDAKIYDKVRKILLDMKFDESNIGKKEWNPFSDLVEEGSTIVIKPNLVIHRNLALFGSMNSIVTNISVIRPVLDYSLKAVGKNGKVIIADAAVQDCDFKKLIKKTKLESMIKEYTKIFNNVFLIDLRKNQNPDINTIEIDLKEKSMFYDQKLEKRKYSITNYSEDMMKTNHSPKMHKYVSSDIILSADLIINLFKPKAHRIAGITAAQKNLIGMISKKECLPHYSHGSIKDGGDEFPDSSKYRIWLANLLKQKNKLLWPIKNFFKIVNQFIPNKSIINGCWYKNDTIWRTILDVNYIINYSDKNGNLKDTIQRKIFNIGDMIICGEKNGPLHPNDKYVGCLIAGFDRNNIDNVVCEMMGFNKEYIKYIDSDVTFKKYINGIETKEIKNYKFKPADGWKILQRGNI